MLSLASHSHGSVEVWEACAVAQYRMDVGVSGDENHEGEWNLCNIGEDSLSTVLSFLSPRDIVACAGVCRQLRAFCKDDQKVWLPMCGRRWGLHTSVQKWGSGRVSFKVLHSVLARLENLIGFWRGVGHGGHGSLVVFDWGPHFVVGYRITPARPSCYKVCKIPFVWIGVTEIGTPIHFFDPCWNIPPLLCNASCASHEHVSSSSVNPTSAHRINPFAQLGPDWDLEHAPPPSGLLVVDLHFVGNFHIVMKELLHPHPPPVAHRSLTEAAVIASFGPCGPSRLADAMSPGSGSSSEPERLGHSPPGSFQYEMYQFLASKVTSQGGDRVYRRQRRRERERALSQGRRTCEPEHFVKVMDVGPTAARPLQGLWKGICDSKVLDLVLLSYEDMSGIVCRRVGECLGTTHSGSVCWTANPDSTIMAPLPVHEQNVFNVRQRIQPAYTDLSGKQEITATIVDGCDEEIVGMLCTIPMPGPDFGFLADVENIEGRVWQYASGGFGFSFLPTNFITDFRPICSPGGLLLDVLEY